jgi:hypothetical protein
VEVVGINAMDATTRQGDLAATCRFPLFQDVPEVGAWALHGGGKDDFFVYDASGQLSAYLPAIGGPNSNLSTVEGYGNLKQALLTALQR